VRAPEDANSLYWGFYNNSSSSSSSSTPSYLGAPWFDLGRLLRYPESGINSFSLSLRKTCQISPYNRPLAHCRINVYTPPMMVTSVNAMTYDLQLTQSSRNISINYLPHKYKHLPNVILINLQRRSNKLKIINKYSNIKFPFD
jgi:hypothetical protein